MQPILTGRDPDAAAANAWRERGFRDANAGRSARTPLRDDDGRSARAYLDGYRAGERERARGAH